MSLGLTHSFDRLLLTKPLCRYMDKKLKYNVKPSKNRGVWAVTKSYDLIYFYTTTLPKDLSNPIYSRFLHMNWAMHLKNAVNGTFR